MKKYFYMFLIFPNFLLAKNNGPAALFEKPTELLESTIETLVAFGIPFFTVSIIVTGYLVYHQRIGKQYLWSSIFGAFILLISESFVKFLFGFFLP